MKLMAIIHKDDEGGYWAEVPALPDCFTNGSSLTEVRENTRDSIIGWLESMNQPFTISQSPDDLVMEIEV